MKKDRPLFEGQLPRIRSPRRKASEIPYVAPGSRFGRRVQKTEKREIPKTVLITPREERWRHGHWWERRRKIRVILRAGGIGERVIERWDNCGSGARVWEHIESGKKTIVGNYCRCRHCEPCMRAKAGRMAANLKARLKERQLEGKRFRFITLSLCHREIPLDTQVKHLYSSFKKLRQLPLWKKTQKGGVFFAEIVWRPDSPSNAQRVHQGKRPLWHPHLHVVCEGSYLDQRELSLAWLQVTKSSSIVHIRLLEDGDEAAHYLTKYVTKSTNQAVWDDEDAGLEWIRASKGLRCAATFGTWRGFRLLHSEYNPEDWRGVCSLVDLLARADAGEEAARNLVLILRPPGETDGPLHPRPPPV